MVVIVGNILSLQSQNWFCDFSDTEKWYVVKIIEKCIHYILTHSHVELFLYDKLWQENV